MSKNAKVNFDLLRPAGSSPRGINAGFLFRTNKGLFHGTEYIQLFAA